MQTRAGAFRATTVAAGESLLLALALFAMDAFAHLRLDVGQFLAAWIAWTAALVLARVWRASAALPAWGAILVESVVPGFFLGELRSWGRGGFTVAQALYALFLVTMLVRGWRGWIGWLDRRGADVTGESVRVLVVGAAAVTVTFPLFTDLLVGGTDALWYAHMLGDFVAQLRAGFFPVFVGQGEQAWNGGVHPFRTAPVFMHVAGLWDLLTWRALGPCALQHLAAITAALAGGLGIYAAGVALAPSRRWETAGVAWLYLCAPAWLLALYHADAYMTWMAIGAMPLALYGNARALLAEDGRGYKSLAAGLALVWMCHPPIGMLTTLATLLLQGGGLLCGNVTPARIRGAVTGALLFAGLGAFYFVGVSELPQREPIALRADVFQLGGLALWFAGFAGPVLRRRSAWWLLLLLPGGWLLWNGRSPWLWWMIATATITVAVVALARWQRWFDPAQRGVEILLASAVLSAGLAHAWLRPNHGTRDIGLLETLGENTAHAAEFFRLLSPEVDQPGDWQPGIGLWIVLGFLAVDFFRTRSVAAKLWFTVSLLPIFMIVRVPGVSEFLAGYAPPWLARVGGLTFTLRLMPTVAGLLAVGWLVWLAGRPKPGKMARIAVRVVILLAVGWSAYEAVVIVRPAFGATASRTVTENRFRAENIVLERFAYDLIPIPTYFSNGVTDPGLQARVLDDLKRVRIDPGVTALRMEETGRTPLRLVCLPYEPPAPDWLRLGPSLTLAPGEHVLLRFEFDARQNYGGYLFMISDRGYREYALPESGLRRAFGTTAKASRVISLWNSGPVAERYAFSFRRGPGCTLPSDGSLFANVFVSHYDAGRALVRVDSLMPYRMIAAMSWPGFVESGRVWLPGYEATVDGRPSAVKVSPEGLAMVPVGAGQHTVELRYRGTGELWVTWFLSAFSWFGLIGSWLWRLKART